MAGGGNQSGEQGQELNLIPYLDIMVNLVLFMLINITGFLSFTVLNASIPQLSTNPEQALDNAKGEELLLVLRVKDDMFVVEPTVTGGPRMAKQTFPMVEDPETKKRVYDVKSLNAMMIKVKERFPEENKILMISNSDVSYENIVHTMDAIRETKAGEEDLFPQVTLSI